jgi:DNA-binding response OmpR family regulator
MSGDYTTAIKAARPQLDILPHEFEVRIFWQYAGKHESFLLKRRRTTFGRGDADVVTEDPTMSRKHFQVEVARNGVVVHDLASANGTIYRGRWITFANLHDGDSFQAGNTRFHITIRTTNMSPARLSALVALDGEEAGALARVLDGDVFAVKTVDPLAMMESVRAELPDVLIVEATPRELTAVENLKRLPRLRHTHVILLLGQENGYLAERCRMAGADEVMERPVAMEALQEVVERLAERPQTRTLNFPASVRAEGHVEAHGRLIELSSRGCRLRFSAEPTLEPGAVVQTRLLLPNEYGVVTARTEVQGVAGQELALNFDSFEGTGQVVIRRILRDAPMRFAGDDK